jgi:hypothetical protein
LQGLPLWQLVQLRLVLVLVQLVLVLVQLRLVRLPHQRIHRQK